MFQRILFLCAVTPVIASGSYADACLKCQRVVCCPTQYSTGDESSDLKVHIVGSRFDVIEAYFNNTVWRGKLPEAVNLHCHGSVLLSPKNDNGTFVVRYGECHDRIRVYGWKASRGKSARFIDLVPQKGTLVQIQWVTDRILKISYSDQGDASYLIRYREDDDNPWQRYDDEHTDPTKAWVVIKNDQGEMDE